MGMEPLDQKAYERWKKRISASVRKFNVSGIDTEDATQSILLAWMSKRGDVKQTIDQAVIDYIKKEYGSNRSVNHLERRQLKQARPFSSFGSDENTQDPACIVDRYAGLSEGVSDNRIDIEALRHEHKGRDRFILEMILEDATLVEIGSELGISQSRVHQLIKKKIYRGIKMKVTLSKSENEVYKLLLTGMTNQQIADKLFVAEKTIKFHLGRIYKKLDVKNRGEAIARRLSEATQQNINPPGRAGLHNRHKAVQGGLSKRVSEKSFSDAERKRALAKVLSENDKGKSRVELQENKGLEGGKSRGVEAFNEEGVFEWSSF